MSKVYIAVKDADSGTHGCVVDLEPVQIGQSKKTANPWELGAQIAEWIRADLERATSIIDAIAQKCLNNESKKFIERVSRLGLSLQKAGSAEHPLDALITFKAPNGELDFLFTTPISAFRAYEQVMNGA